MKKAIILLTTLAVISLLLIAGCSNKSDPIPINGNQSDSQKIALNNNEILQSDIFANYEKGNFNSRKITVLGAKLGDSPDQVIAKAGKPDQIRDFGEDGVNFEYGDRFGINETVLIFHFTNGNLTRWTVFRELDDKLFGNTKLDKTEESVYRTVGLPDKTWFVGEHLKLMYNDGFDIILDTHKKSLSLSFLFPEVQQVLTQQIYETQKRVIGMSGSRSENSTE